MGRHNIVPFGFNYFDMRNNMNALMCLVVLVALSVPANSCDDIVERKLNGELAEIAKLGVLQKGV